MHQAPICEAFPPGLDYLPELCNPAPKTDLGEAELRPFLFCRYALSVDDEGLTATAQFKALSDLQGKPVAHGSKAVEEKNYDTLVMRPKKLRISGKDAFFWSVGVTIKERLRATYDKVKDRIDLELIKDGSVRFNDFVAIPSLSVLAVDDRGGEMHLGGKAAINRFRSVFRTLDGGDVNITFEATPDEVRKALRKWALTKFKFTIQPNNPRPVERLSQALSDQFKKDGIAKLTGTAQPAEAERMHMHKDGFIGAAAGLVEAGYGQMSVAGVTEDGLQAEIKKPRFDADVEKNEKIQEKPRELRVFVDDEDMTDQQVAETAAAALIKFHEDGGEKQ